MIRICTDASYCWILTVPLGEEVRSHGIDGIHTKSHVKDKQQIHLFIYGESLIYPSPSTQTALDLFMLFGYPSLDRHDQDL